MEQTNAEGAASPAPESGDENRSGNISVGQAAAVLFAKSQQQAKEEKTPPPAPPAEENVAPEKSEKAEVNPSAEAENATAETESEDSAPAEGTEATAEGEAEEDGDHVLSHKSPLDPKLREEIQKRINKEVAKRKLLETRLGELDANLKRLEAEKTQPPPAPMPKGTMPLSDIQDLDALAKHKQQAKEAVRWAEEQLDRDDLGEGVQVGNEVFDRARLKGIMKAAKMTLEDHIPAREEFLKTRQQVSQQAMSLFPFLQDKTSEEFQMAVAAYRANPWLQDLPNADFIVGVQVEGLKALKARTAAKAKSEEKPKPKVPPAKPAGDQTAVSSGTSAGRVSPQAGAKSALAMEREKMTSKGAITASEAAAMLLRSEQLRNTR